MPDNDPKKLFKKLPTQIPFPFDQKLHSPRGLCWFAGQDGMLPDAEAIWRDFFEATEAELSFANDKTNVRKVMADSKLLGIPYKYLPLEVEGNQDEDWEKMSLALGKDRFADNYLYDIEVEPNGILVAGRSSKDMLPPLVEDTLLFFCVMQKFFVHPSRIASGKGKDVFGVKDYEPSEDESLLGPWCFTSFRGASLDDLKPKAASLLNTIDTPDRLWAAYLRLDAPIVDTAVFSLVEAGGEVLDRPVMLFDVSSDITFGTMDGQPPMRLFFFWRD